MGASDSGSVEYDGNILRFMGKKSRIEIPAIGEISEVRVRFNLVHLLIWFCSAAVLEFIVWYCLHLYFDWVRWDLLVVILILGLALFLAVCYWLYIRNYGKWVCISFSPLDGQPREVCFWAPPVSGGSQRLYKDLSQLHTSQSPRK